MELAQAYADRARRRPGNRRRAQGCGGVRDGRNARAVPGWGWRANGAASARRPGRGIAWFAGFTAAMVVVVMLPGRSGGSGTQRRWRRSVARGGEVRRRLVGAGRSRGTDGGKPSVTVRVGAQTLTCAGALRGGGAGRRSRDVSAPPRRAGHKAVAVRTYAMRLRGRHAAEGYDFLLDDTLQHIEPRAIASRWRKRRRPRG